MKKKPHKKKTTAITCAHLTVGFVVFLTIVVAAPHSISDAVTNKMDKLMI